jgi:hypothetical protein
MVESVNRRRLVIDLSLKGYNGFIVWLSRLGAAVPWARDPLWDFHRNLARVSLHLTFLNQ